MSIKKKKIGSRAVGMSQKAMMAQQLYSKPRMVGYRNRPRDMFDVVVRKACNAWWAKQRDLAFKEVIDDNGKD